MQTPEIPTLRPLSLGELLDQAIRIYRRNFLTFIGIIAVVYVPLTILQIAAGAVMSSSILNINRNSPEALFNNPGYWISLLSAMVLAFVQFFLVQGIATGALTRAVADNYLGRTASILDAYRGIGKVWVSLIGALLFVGLISIIAIVWGIIVPCLGWFTGLGMLVFLGGVINPLVASAVVLERQTAIAAVTRAWSLARRRFWPVLGYIFVLYLFSMLIVGGPTAIVNAILTGLMPTIKDPVTLTVISTIVQSLVSLVGTLIYYPLQMTAFTLIYFDLRVRTEGFDIALLTASASGEAGVDQVMSPPPTPDERLITWPDLGNFAILTLGALGIYVLFFSLIAGVAVLIPSLLLR